MKSVLAGPVTNHFSPLRTYSPVAGSRTAVAASVRASDPWPGSGDGVGPAALAAQAGDEVALALLGGAVDECVVGTRDVGPQATRRLAELLV